MQSTDTQFPASFHYLPFTVACSLVSTSSDYWITFSKRKSWSRPMDSEGFLVHLYTVLGDGISHFPPWQFMLSFFLIQITGVRLESIVCSDCKALSDKFVIWDYVKRYGELEYDCIFKPFCIQSCGLSQWDLEWMSTFTQVL